jgi:hypothetical protein
MQLDSAQNLTEDELADLKARHARTHTANDAAYGGPSCAACDDGQPTPCQVTRLIQMYERLRQGRTDTSPRPPI